MSHSLFDTIRKIVREELGLVRTAELAVVQAQHSHADEGDKDNYACTVALRDSGIVLKQVPVATQRIGTASIPAVGDLVLVQFVGGSINAPIITGRLYNDEDRPPVNADQQAILHLPPGAGDSDAVHLELQSGDTRQLLFTLGDALELTAKDDDPVIELSVDGGKAKVTIDRDGAVTIESQGNIRFKGSEVKIEGQTIAVEAQSELTLKGGVVNIN